MVHDNRCPLYLSESVQPVSSNPARQRLRSASSLDFVVPRKELSLKTKPSLLPVRQYGTICLSLSDQLRLLLVSSASAGTKLTTYCIVLYIVRCEAVLLCECANRYVIY